ncbi:hypothetical protein [Enterococcus villorum]|nr:hypothetical protein [Enterococcus villorum]
MLESEHLQNSLFLNGIFQVDSSALTPNNAKHGMLFSFVAP